jgi:hypothetical protein
MKSATEAADNGIVKHDIIDKQDTTIYADSLLDQGVKWVDESLKAPQRGLNPEEIQARIQRGVELVIRVGNPTPPVTGAYPAKGRPFKE